MGCQRIHMDLNKLLRSHCRTLAGVAHSAKGSSRVDRVPTLLIVSAIRFVVEHGIRCEGIPIRVNVRDDVSPCITTNIRRHPWRAIVHLVSSCVLCRIPRHSDTAIRVRRSSSSVTDCHLHSSSRCSVGGIIEWPGPHQCGGQNDPYASKTANGRTQELFSQEIKSYLTGENKSAFP